MVYIYLRNLQYQHQNKSTHKYCIPYPETVSFRPSGIPSNLRYLQSIFLIRVRMHRHSFPDAGHKNTAKRNITFLYVLNVFRTFNLFFVHVRFINLFCFNRMDLPSDPFTFQAAEVYRKYTMRMDFHSSILCIRGPASLTEPRALLYIMRVCQTEAIYPIAVCSRE